MTSVRIEYLCPDGTPFPVEFPDEASSQHGWIWDQLHSPSPVTPMGAEFHELKVAGFRGGGQAVGNPAAVHFFFSNGYAYRVSLPAAPEELEELRVIRERDLRLRMERAVELWESRYRPEVEALRRSLLAWALPGDSFRALMGRFDEVVAAVQRLGELHVIVNAPAGAAATVFEQFCISRFGEQGPRIAREAVAGVPNKSLASGEALWNLSREVLARPEVATLLRAAPGATFVESLGSCEGGDAFHALLREFIVAKHPKSTSRRSELSFDPERLSKRASRSYAWRRSLSPGEASLDPCGVNR